MYTANYVCPCVSVYISNTMFIHWLASSLAHTRTHTVHELIHKKRIIQSRNRKLRNISKQQQLYDSFRCFFFFFLLYYYYCFFFFFLSIIRRRANCQNIFIFSLFESQFLTYAFTYRLIYLYVYTSNAHTSYIYSKSKKKHTKSHNFTKQL